MSAMPSPGELPATGGRSSQPHGQRAVNTTRFGWVLVRSTAVLGAGSEPAFLCTSRSAASGTPGVDVSGRGRHGVNVAPTKAIATSNAMTLFLCIWRNHSTGLVDGPPCSAEHAAATFSGSRMTSRSPSSSRAGVRFASITSSTAAPRFSPASSRVAPSVLAPSGSSYEGDVAFRYLPEDRGKRLASTPRAASPAGSSERRS